MNYSWRKRSQHIPRRSQDLFETSRITLKQFIIKLKKREFVIVWIDESAFNSACITSLLLDANRIGCWSYN